MTPKGQNIENVKINNRASVLRLLFAKSPMSRVDIASKLNLTPSTVTIICNDFFSRNLLVQHKGSDMERKVGRKKSPIAINYNYKFVLAIHIHAQQTDIYVCNLAGERIRSMAVPTNKALSPQAFLALVAADCIKLLWALGFSNEDMLGVGVSIIGPVNHVRGVSLNAFSIWKEPVNVKALLEEELGLPVYVESNICAAMGAILLYSVEINNVLAIAWGPGVGSASVINGRVFKGTNFQSSELGHNFVDRVGEKCRCGKIGCLETQVSIQKIIAKLEELANSPDGKVIADQIKAVGAPTRETLHEFLDIPYAAFQQFLSDCAYSLAVVLNNAIQILPPDHIVVFGELLQQEKMLRLLKGHLLSINTSVSEDIFMMNPFGGAVNWMGATANVVRRLLVDQGGFEG